MSSPTLIQRIINAFRVPSEVEVQKDLGSMGFPSSSLTFALGLWPSNTGTPVSPIAALQASTVYACIRRLSEDLAKLPIRVRKRSKKGGWVDATDHPLIRLFRSPNAWQTQFELISYIVGSLQMRGNGYTYVARRSDGTPKRLIPLLPDRVSVMLTQENGEIFYNLTSPQLGSQTIHATPDDIIHVRNLSLDTGILGVSPIACSQDSIGLALATQRHAALFFRQGTSLNGVLEAPTRLSSEAALRMSQSWQDAYSGSENHHKVAVLEEGVRFNALTISPEDAQLVETQRWSAEQICRIFAVPPWLVGLPVNSGVYSNVEQSQLTYVTNTLSGLATKIEQELERVLLFEDEREDYDIVFDFDSLLRGDLKSRYESYQIAFLNGWLNANEIREKEGLEAVEGGDEYHVPVNLTAGGKPTDNSQETTTGGDKQPAESPK